MEFQRFNLALISGINFISALLQASVGFGYAILAMALMPLVLPMRLCSAISAVTVVIIAIQMVIMLRKHLNLRLIFIPVLFCMLTTNLGLYILMNYPEEILRIILAIFLVFLTIFFATTQKKKSLKIKKTLLSSILFGLLTGISTGMFNIVGPFLMVYYLNICDDHLSFKANIEFSFLIAGIYSTILHIIYGNIDLEVAPYIVGSAIAVILAGFVGIRLFRKLNRGMVTRVIYIALPIMALLLIKDIR